METSNLLPCQNTLLFYCTLYTNFSCGNTDAVAHHMSIAKITFNHFWQKIVNPAHRPG